MSPGSYVSERSQSTMAYRSRSDFSSDRISRWEVEVEGGVLHEKADLACCRRHVREAGLSGLLRPGSHEVASYLGAAFSYDEMDIKMLEPELFRSVVGNSFTP
jgi:hypothetical protein